VSSAPLVITEDAKLQCDHLGKVDNKPSQSLVTIDGRRILVATDPQGRTIHMCPNLTPATKPCTHTLVVEEGYSTFVKIDGHAVCLATVKGHTDGTPPGTVFYTVADSGQAHVSIAT
jgi:hypothetical protein